MSDETLVNRLRELSMVNVDALIHGVSDAEYQDLLRHYVGDMKDALGQAEDRVMDLKPRTTKSLFGRVRMKPENRVTEKGAQLTEWAQAEFHDVAANLRASALIIDAAALVLPKLLAAERRLVAG
jgi:hypothetical protein